MSGRDTICTACGVSRWAHEGDISQMGHTFVAPHTVTLEIASGIDGWRMDCPYELADATRPCWPCEEDGTPDEDGFCCTWVDWFENLHPTEAISHATAVTWNVEATWPGDSPEFILTDPSAPGRSSDG